MQASILSLVLALGASQVVAQYTNQSAPFNLILCSSNATLNGALLGACHEGAAIEGLCPSIGGNASASYNQFTFNYTSEQTPDPVFGITGLLVRAPLRSIFLQFWYIGEDFLSHRTTHKMWNIHSSDCSTNRPIFIPIFSRS
jgi:hypothetical protein